MTDGKVTLNRPLVGIIALACLGAAAGLFFSGSTTGERSLVMGGGAAAAFFRVGLLMGALWLALPPKGQEAPWATVTPGTFVGLLLAIFAVVRMKWLAIPLLALFAIMALIIRPRTKYRPPRN
jgi:hypothetical protein